MIEFCLLVIIALLIVLILTVLDIQKDSSRIRLNTNETKWLLINTADNIDKIKKHLGIF